MAFTKTSFVNKSCLNSWGFPYRNRVGSVHVSCTLLQRFYTRTRFQTPSFMEPENDRHSACGPLDLVPKTCTYQFQVDSCCSSPSKAPSSSRATPSTTDQMGPSKHFMAGRRTKIKRARSHGCAPLSLLDTEPTKSYTL